MKDECKALRKDSARELHPSSFIIHRLPRKALPVRGRGDSLLPAFGGDHLSENAHFLLFVKGALFQGCFGLAKFA